MEDIESLSSPQQLDNLEEENMTEISGKDLTVDKDKEDPTETPEMTLARVLAISDEMPQKPQLLNDIGNTFFSLFGNTRAECDISNSILAFELAVNLLPATDARLAEFLSDYGYSVLGRYELKGMVADIDKAISSRRKALDLTVQGHTDLPLRLDNLGVSLSARFKGIGDLADISEAISFQEKSIQLTPEGHVSLLVRLNNLGISFQRRFGRTGKLADISEAISLQQKSIQLIPKGHAALPTLLSNLGFSLQRRFQCTGGLDDISEAISMQQNSIQLTPEGHADLPVRLNNLGLSLRTHFERTGELANISEAISLQKRAIQLTAEGHPYLPIWLDNLGNSLHSRFQRTAELADIFEAISLQKKSILLTPQGHASLPSRLNNLGSSFHRRFQGTGNVIDLSEAISLQQKSIQITPEGHADLPVWLDNLGFSLRRRFGRTGGLPDISEAVSMQQKSIQLTPAGHASLPLSLNNLGLSLQIRFDRTGELADISEAILLQQKSIQLTPEGHAYLPIWLDNLGISLHSRFERTGQLADICEAISLQKKSIQLTPEGHAALPVRLNNLGISLKSRFDHTGRLAISLPQKSIQLIPKGHAEQPICLTNPGVSLVSSQHTENLVDLSEAISLLQKSIRLTPDGHPSVPVYLNSLGFLHQVYFQCTQDAVAVQNAILNYRLSATSVSGSPSVRLSAARSWTRLAQEIDESQLMEAYHITMGLISQVAGLDQTIQNRYTNLINISELSSSAAASAINLGNPSLALEWLEQGRCLVWSQLDDLRTPIDELRIHHPALADDIMRVSRALENAGSRAEPASYTEETSMTTKITIQDEVHTHIKLAQEWDHLLIQVRAIPHFADFLRPASCSGLLETIPISGRVVVINIHKDRSDALVLTSGASEPLHIALPEFPYDKADNLRHQLKALLVDSKIRMRGFELDDTRGSRRYVPGIADILRQLWTFVVKPILVGIGHSVPLPNLPRIWWCVTGPLAFLPLHAAGIYSPAGSTPGAYTTLSDFAVSSYTPTVRSLVAAKSKSRANPKKKGLLAISQPDTPGQSRIPGTTAEVTAIQRLLTNQKVEHLPLASGDATVSRVKEQMDAYSCIHFACHAAQNTTKPLQSGFYLYDGRLELSEIIKKRLIGADLAFLSACQTSTGDEKLSEEAVHLAGGMLAAGYRGVVATMWSIKDSYGPKIAEEFYTSLLSHKEEDESGSGKLSSDGAAHALHHATQQVRKTLDNSESSLLTWVPYVHFGL